MIDIQITLTLSQALTRKNVLERLMLDNPDKRQKYRFSIELYKLNQYISTLY